APPSVPRARSSPASGGSSVATALTNVVLPAPFGPSSAVTRPDSATRSRPASASTSPNRLTRPCASMMEVMWGLSSSEQLVGADHREGLDDRRLGEPLRGLLPPLAELGGGLGR